MLACRVFGHRYRFRAEGNTMLWDCARCDAVGGVKEYPTPEQAHRYAAALDRADTESLGRRAPLFGLFPLRIAHYIRRKMSS